MENATILAMKKYTRLIFDADNTLYDFNRAEAQALSDTLAHFSLPQTADTLQTYRAINRDLWSRFEQKTITLEALKIERAQRFFSHLGVQMEEAVFAQHYLSELSRHQFLLPQVEETLAALSPHCEMIIITNGLSQVQRPRFEHALIKQHFSDIIISEEVGLAKPDAAIFDMACQRMGWTDTSDVLMIGDNYHCDVKGAVNYGLRACWFNLFEQASTERHHHYEIRCISELLAIVT